MIDDVQNHLAPRHGAVATADKNKTNNFLQFALISCVTIGYIPIVNDPLSRPKVSEGRRLGGVARDEAVRPTLQMRLKDLIDDVVVIQRVSDVPKGAHARSGHLFRGKSAGCLKNELVGPRAVTRHDSQGMSEAHLDISYGSST